MLYQELPRIDSTPLDGWGRWLAPALILGAALSAALVLLLFGQVVPGLLAVAAGLAGAGVAYMRTPTMTAPGEPLAVGPHY